MKKSAVIGLMIITMFFAWYGLHPILDKHFSINLGKAQGSTLKAGTLVIKPKRIIDFQLLDNKGQVFTQKNLYGTWTLLFFGYADCPVICPKTLSILAELWRILPNTPQHQKQLVFVSLNPKIDTPEHLSQFLAKFNPEFKGLTGTEEAITTLSRNCRIYSWKDPNARHRSEIVIDHTASILLVNPQGQVKAIFSPPHDATHLAEDLSQLLG